MLCGESFQTAATRGSKLMFGSSSWNPSGSVRVLIAVGLAIIGAVLVWTALARPSIPEAAPAPGTSDQSMPSTSPSAPQATPGRPIARADKTDVRDKTTGVVLPESHPVACRYTEDWCPIEVGRPWKDGWKDGRAKACRRWLVHRGAHTRCARPGRDRRARHLERACGLLPPR